MGGGECSVADLMRLILSRKKLESRVPRELIPLSPLSMIGLRFHQWIAIIDEDF